MTDAQYELKFQDMQKHIPFIQKVIGRLKVNTDEHGDNPRKAQLHKMEMLYDLLTNPAKKLKMDTLVKFEGVIIKLKAKMEKHSKFLQSEDAVAKTAGNFKPEQTNFYNLQASTSQSFKYKSSNRDAVSAPASPSPELTIVDDDDEVQPVVIPTERMDSPIEIQDNDLRQSLAMDKTKSNKSGQHEHKKPHHHTHHSHRPAKESSKLEELRKHQNRSRNNSPIHKEKHDKVGLSTPHMQRPGSTNSTYQALPSSHSSNHKDNRQEVPSKSHHTAHSKDSTSSKSSLYQTVKVVITEPLPEDLAKQHFPPQHLHLYQTATQYSPEPREHQRFSNNIEVNIEELPPPPPPLPKSNPSIEEAYNPDEGWDNYNEEHKNAKSKLQSSSGTGTIFSRLGKKISEEETILLGTNPPANINIPNRTITPLTDVLKSPPLSFSDINNLLIESGLEQPIGDISEIGTRRPKKPDVSETTSSALDIVRRKFANIAKINQPQNCETTTSYMDLVKEKQKIETHDAKEKLGLKYISHPGHERLHSISSNDGSECSQQSSTRISGSPSDPRFKLKNSITSTSPMNPLPVTINSDPRLKKLNNEPLNKPPSNVLNVRPDPRLARQPQMPIPPIARQMSISQSYVEDSWSSGDTAKVLSKQQSLFNIQSPKEKIWDSDTDVRNKTNILPLPRPSYVAPHIVPPGNMFGGVRTDPRLTRRPSISQPIETHSQAATIDMNFEARTEVQQGPTRFMGNRSYLNQQSSVSYNNSSFVNTTILSQSSNSMPNYLVGPNNASQDSNRFNYVGKQHQSFGPRTYKEHKEAREESRRKALEAEKNAERKNNMEVAKKIFLNDKEKQSKEDDRSKNKVQEKPNHSEDKRKEIIKAKEAFNNKDTKQKDQEKVSNLALKESAKVAAADSTLDKMYRSQNFNTQFPKAALSFKIPKKKTEEPKQENKADKIKSSIKTGGQKNTLTKDTNVKSQKTTVDSSHSGGSKKVEKPKPTEIKDNSSTKINLKPRDPRCKKKENDEHSIEDNKNSEPTKKESSKATKSETNKHNKIESIELSKMNKEEETKTGTTEEIVTVKDKEKISKTLDKDLEQFKLDTQAKLAAKFTDPKPDSPLISPEFKPQRIMRRRNTMLTIGSAPLVDKDKIMKANALMLEDIEEREKLKRKKEEQETQAARRNRHLSEMFKETDDNCSVSTQNIITGKRKTRASINFNETQNAQKVFKHLTVKDATTVAASAASSTNITKRRKSVKANENTSNSIGNLSDKAEDGKTEKLEGSLHSKDSLESKDREIDAKDSKETSQETENKTVQNLEEANDIIILKDNINNKKQQTKLSKTKDIPASSKKADKNIPTDSIRRTAEENEKTEHDLRIENIREQEHQNCIVSSTSVEAPTTNELPSTSTKSLKLSKTITDDNEPTTTENKSSNATPTPADDESNRRDFLLDIVQEIIKNKEGNRQQLLSVLGQILNPEGMQFVENVIASMKADNEDENKEAEEIEETPKNTVNISKKKKTSMINEEETDVTKIQLDDSNSDDGGTINSKRSKRIAKHVRRSELDRLNDDIRDMFICEGVLTATGRRMCTLMQSNEKKEIDNETSLNQSGQDITGSKKTKSLRAAVKKPSSGKQPLRRSLRAPKPSETSGNDSLNGDEVEVIAYNDDSNDSTPSKKRMPALKPHTPVKLAEEIETSNDSGLTNKTKRRKPTSKPCPKSKKSKICKNEKEMDESDNSSETPTESDNEITEEPQSSSSLQAVTNTSSHWHTQSKYTTSCVVCNKKIPFTSSACHYKLNHGENYISRLPPSILKQYKQGKLNQPLFGVDRSTRPSWFYWCPFCLQHFNTPMALWLEHFLNHTAEYRYECSICHWGSNRVASTRRHINKSCKEAKIESSVVKLDKPCEIKAYVCHFCSFIQLKRSNLDRHYVEQHGLPANEVDIVGYTITLFNHDDVELVPEDMAHAKEDKIRKEIAEREKVVIELKEDEEDTESNQEKAKKDALELEDTVLIEKDDNRKDNNKLTLKADKTSVTEKNQDSGINNSDGVEVENMQMEYKEMVESNLENSSLKKLTETEKTPEENAAKCSSVFTKASTSQKTATEKENSTADVVRPEKENLTADVRPGNENSTTDVLNPKDMLDSKKTEKDKTARENSKPELEKTNYSNGQHKVQGETEKDKEAATSTEVITEEKTDSEKAMNAEKPSLTQNVDKTLKSKNTSEVILPKKTVAYSYKANALKRIEENLKATIQKESECKNKQNSFLNKEKEPNTTSSMDSVLNNDKEVNLNSSKDSSKNNVKVMQPTISKTNTSTDETIPSKSAEIKPKESIPAEHIKQTNKEVFETPKVVTPKEVGTFSAAFDSDKNISHEQTKTPTKGAAKGSEGRELMIKSQDDQTTNQDNDIQLSARQLSLNKIKTQSKPKSKTIMSAKTTQNIRLPKFNSALVTATYSKKKRISETVTDNNDANRDDMVCYKSLEDELLTLAAKVADEEEREMREKERKTPESFELFAGIDCRKTPPLESEYNTSDPLKIMPTATETTKSNDQHLTSKTKMSDIIENSIDACYLNNKRKSNDEAIQDQNANKKMCIQTNSSESNPKTPNENQVNSQQMFLEENLLTSISNEKPVSSPQIYLEENPIPKNANVKPVNFSDIVEENRKKQTLNTTLETTGTDSPPIQILAQSIITLVPEEGNNKPQTISIAERLSQRLTILKKKETSLPKIDQTTDTVNANKISSETVDSKTNIVMKNSTESNVTASNEVTTISDDEDWEDIEITESAPNPMPSNNLQKTKNKGLLQKYGLFKGNSSSKTKKNMTPLLFMPKKKIKERQTPTASCSPVTTPKTLNSDKPNTPVGDAITQHLGFKPVIHNIEDLLPDSPCNDPMDLVPELAPFEPLTDLNDISSILDSNLIINTQEESQTCIQDALDFICEQQANEHQTQKQPATADVEIKTKFHKNKIQHVGYSFTSQGLDKVKFYCLLENCSFLFSSEAMGLENHFICEHSHTKWNGYCCKCQKQCMDKQQQGYSIVEEIKHMVDCHLNVSTYAADSNSNDSSQHSTTTQTIPVAEDRPRIKLRRMTGDCLSTSNSESPTPSAGLIQSTTIQEGINNEPPPLASTLLGALLIAKQKPPTIEMPPQPEMPLTEPLLIENSPAPVITNLGKDFNLTPVCSTVALPSNAPLNPSTFQISNVVSLNNMSKEMPIISPCVNLNNVGSIWSQQIVQEKQNLLQTAAESLEMSTMLANASRPAEQRNPSLNRSSRENSQGPVVISETLPVTQEKRGDFVITQTVMAQYDSHSSAAVGFNINIQPANIAQSTLDIRACQNNSNNAISIPDTVSAFNDEDSRNSVSLIDSGDSNTTQLITSRQYKCMSKGCKFTSRVPVAMSDHLRFHERRNFSNNCDYLGCAFCNYQATDVQDYMKHSDQYHIITKGTKVSEAIPTTSSLSAVAVRGNICDILSKKMESTSQRTLAALREGQRTAQLKQKEVEQEYLSKLKATIEEIVGPTGYSDNNLYRCVIKNCPTKLTESTFHNHIMYHISTLGISNPNNFVFKCPHCTAQYQRPAGIKTHIKSHSRNRFFCYMCHMTSGSGGQLMKHFSEAHWPTINMYTKELLKPNTYLSEDGSEKIHDSGYIVAHSSEISDAEVRKYGEKLILEWQRKKSGSKTHFKSSEIDLLPIQSIFQREVNCGECQYKTKVRTNMQRHLSMHKQYAQQPNTTQQSLVGSVDPVNPVPCLNSNERFFDKMTNLASSSLIPSITANTAKAVYKLPYPFVAEENRFKCGVPNCNYITLSEDVFRSHLTLVHSGAMLFRCPFCQEEICKRGLSYERIMSHLRFHAAVLFRCEECNYVHHLRFVVERHMNEKHATMKVNIITHERTDALGEGTMTALSFTGKKYKEPADASTVTQPAVTTSKVIPALTVTRSSTSTATSNTEPSAMSSNSIISTATKSKPKWNCDLCDHVANSQNLIQTHCQNAHGQNKQYQCIHCSFGSHQLSQILYHIDEKHEGKTREARSIYHKTVNNNELDVADTRPLWQRNDPTRVRYIRGIPMEDEEESERNRKKMGLDKMIDDDDDDDDDVDANSTSLMDFLQAYEFGCFYCDFKTMRFEELSSTHYKSAHCESDETSKPFIFRLLRRVCCPECRSYTGNFIELQLHLINTHKTRQYYAADICNSENEDTTNRLDCGYCSYHCLKSDQLLKHFLNPKTQHYPEDVRIDNDRQIKDVIEMGRKQIYFRCTLCSHLLSNRVSVVHHATNTHENEEGFSFRELTNTLVYHCPLCSFTSGTETELYRHMIDHYRRFKKCHFCYKPQDAFESYMQHCYAEHREDISRFREIYPYTDIQKFLYDMLLLFPNGLIISKRNLMYTKPYGYKNAMVEFYEEMYKISQQPPIPRLSIARLVARKSIETYNKQVSVESQQHTDTNQDQTAASTALVAKKITKRRSTVLIESQCVDKGLSVRPSTSKACKIASHKKSTKSASLMDDDSSSNHSSEFSMPLAQAVRKKKRRHSFFATDDGTSAAITLKQLHNDGSKRLKLNEDYSTNTSSNEEETVSDEEPLDFSKIYTRVAIGGIINRVSIDKFRQLFNTDCQVELTRCDDTNITSYKQYKHIKKACPASHKLKYT